MKTITEYLQEHPDSTLREYHQYVEEIENAESAEKQKLREEAKELFKSYYGKCFKLDFNDNCRAYFKLTEDISDLETHPKLDTYEVVVSDDNVWVTFSKKRSINNIWFPNKLWGQYGNKFEAISEDEFNKIVEKYQEIVAFAKELKNS